MGPLFQRLLFSSEVEPQGPNGVGGGEGLVEKY